jgi:hypothetical protein
MRAICFDLAAVGEEQTVKKTIERCEERRGPKKKKEKKLPCSPVLLALKKFPLCFQDPARFSLVCFSSSLKFKSRYSNFVGIRHTDFNSCTKPTPLQKAKGGTIFFFFLVFSSYGHQV